MSRSDRQAEIWQGLGKLDPDWAVITDPHRRGRAWETAHDEFYDTGVTDVDECLALLPRPPATARALDFGSGTGRLTMALASHFDHVTAVDASTSMLGVLQRRLSARDVTNFSTATTKELPLPGHDFVLSLLVLQHLEHRRAVRAALDNLAASMSPGAQAVLEMPERALTIRARLQPRFRIYNMVRRLRVPVGWLQGRGLSGISMLTVRRADFEAWLSQAGLRVASVAVRQTHDYLYIRYVAVKEAA